MIESVLIDTYEWVYYRPAVDSVNQDVDWVSTESWPRVDRRYQCAFDCGCTMASSTKFGKSILQDAEMWADNYCTYHGWWRILFTCHFKVIRFWDNSLQENAWSLQNLARIGLTTCTKDIHTYLYLTPTDWTLRKLYRKRKIIKSIYSWSQNHKGSILPKPTTFS